MRASRNRVTFRNTFHKCDVVSKIDNSLSLKRKICFVTMPQLQGHVVFDGSVICLKSKNKHESEFRGLCRYVLAAFNIIGVTSLGLNLDDVDAKAHFAIGLDAVAAVFFAAGAVMCVLDIQGVCMRRPPSTIGKGLLRPF